MGEIKFEFLSCIEDIGAARECVERLIRDVQHRREYAYVVPHGEKIDYLASVGLLLHAAFRLMKHVQNGNSLSNLRSARMLVVEAANLPPLDEYEQALSRGLLHREEGK